MKDFQSFIADPRLTSVTETLKKSTDIFSIIKPKETQHSEILQWLFNSREGHGQGDALFKDFLMAAHSVSDDNVECNQKFFNTWKPSRISLTGFNSLFAIREYKLNSNKRLDLLMVDMTNKLLVVVENKHGAKLGEKQLDNYYSEVSQEIRRRPVFKDFLTAHIVLDRNADIDGSEATSGGSKLNRWALLDYSWLKAGAERAKNQLKRGNHSAALVIAYCQKQSDCTSHDEIQEDDIFADIAGDYQDVIEKFNSASTKSISDLTPTDLVGEKGEIWHFVNHYPEIVDRLRKKVALSYVIPEFRKTNPKAKIKTNYSQKWLNIWEDSWVSLMDHNSRKHLPLYVSIWETDIEKIYSVGVSYYSSLVDETYQASLFVALKKEFPELAKGRQNAHRRILGKFPDLTKEMVTSKAINIYERLNKIIVEILGTH